MRSQSGFIKLSEARKRFSALAIVTLLAPAFAGADILPPLRPQSIKPGDFLSYPVSYNPVAGVRLHLRVENGPDGARMTVDPTGQARIIWQSPADFSAEANIGLVVRNSDTGEKLESRVLLIRAAEPIVESKTTSVSLGPFETQDFIAGEQWEWVFNVDPAKIQLSAGGLPPGAMFINDPNKGYLFRWTPTLEQHGLYEVNLEAVNRYDRDTVTNSSIKLQVNLPVVPGSSDNPHIPKILPLANQVVSAGRIISFKVSSVAEDGTVPVLLVDRIPRDASFDGNENGSRTFFWQTGDRDQGEHVFRFTAVNPREPELRSYKDVLIVVGDPTRNKTAPQ